MSDTTAHARVPILGTAYTLTSSTTDDAGTLLSVVDDQGQPAHAFTVADARRVGAVLAAAGVELDTWPPASLRLEDAVGVAW